MTRQRYAITAATGFVLVVGTAWLLYLAGHQDAAQAVLSFLVLAALLARPRLRFSDFRSSRTTHLSD